MDGIHDLGGMQGFGKINHKNNHHHYNEKLYQWYFIYE